MIQNRMTDKDAIVLATGLVLMWLLYRLKTSGLKRHSTWKDLFEVIKNRGLKVDTLTETAGVLAAIFLIIAGVAFWSEIFGQD